MLATGSHTVLVFEKIQFKGNWTRWSGTTMTGYTPNNTSNNLIVVEQSSAGIFTTYFFKLKVGVDVWVDVGENVVHVPALCIKATPGDQTHCGD